MAIAPINNGLILVGGFDISGFTGSIEETPGSVGLVPVTTFGSGGFVQQVPSIKSGTFRFSGYADPTTSTGISSAFTSSSIGTQYGVSVAVPMSGTSPTYADPCVFGTGKLNEYNPLTTAPDEAGAMSMGFMSDAQFVYGKVGAPLASRTTSGLTGTTVAMTGPTATQSLYALLHVTAAAGTNLVVKVQSDDNSGFTTPTDRITFTTTSATGWELKSVAGNLSTETHWRVTATIATSTFSFAVFFGVV